MAPTDARFVWLSGLAVLIGALLFATALSALSQLVANASAGTTRPGHTLATLRGTRGLLAAMRAHADELAPSPCVFDAALERAAMGRAIYHAEALGVDAAAAAALATLLAACSRQTSCREPPELGRVLVRSWVDAVGEWRQMDCAAAGSL